MPESPCPQAPLPKAFRDSDRLKRQDGPAGEAISGITRREGLGFVIPVAARFNLAGRYSASSRRRRFLVSCHPPTHQRHRQCPVRAIACGRPVARPDQSSSRPYLTSEGHLPASSQVAINQRRGHFHHRSRSSAWPPSHPLWVSTRQNVGTFTGNFITDRHLSGNKVTRKMAYCYLATSGGLRSIRCRMSRQKNRQRRHRRHRAAFPHLGQMLEVEAVLASAPHAASAAGSAQDHRNAVSRSNLLR